MSGALAPGMWETRIEPALVKHAHWFLLLILLLGVARIVSTYHVFSTTEDEPAHVACGLQYLAKHVYYYETQHPPLTRAMIALLPYLSGTRPQNKPRFTQEGWALLTYQNHPEQTVMLMRLGNLPFFVLGCLVVYVWGRRYFGAATGVLAALCYTLIPTVLAHAGLATTDMGLASTLAAAFLAMLIWVEEPTLLRGAIFGFCLALAMLSKFTSLGFFPMAVAIALAYYLAARRPGMAELVRLAKARTASFALAAGVCLFTIWAAYFFSFGKVPFWNVSLPAWGYFDGIRVAMLHNTEGHPAWLLGEARRFGWWYYFPVALAVKTPLALLLLLAVGVAVCWQNHRRIAYLMPLAFIVGVLLPAMAGRINIGVRHVLPVYLAFSVMAAIGIVHLARAANRKLWAGAAAGILMVWLAATGAIHHPDYIPYFNELVQGPPDRILCDSDFDWGQDTKRLAARLKQLGATQVNFGAIYAGASAFLEAYPGLPKVTPIHPIEPSEGWTAISPTLDHAAQYGLNYRYPNLKLWYSNLPVYERVGTIDLIYLPPGSVRKRL
ncbi:MAG: glycosyltransferase family 39 protein [Candidatus Solibacter sp.]